jgi:hypothetical protein
MQARALPGSAWPPPTSSTPHGRGDRRRPSYCSIEATPLAGAETARLTSDSAWVAGFGLGPLVPWVTSLGEAASHDLRELRWGELASEPESDSTSAAGRIATTRSRAPAALTLGRVGLRRMIAAALTRLDAGHADAVTMRHARTVAVEGEHPRHHPPQRPAPRDGAGRRPSRATRPTFWPCRRCSGTPRSASIRSSRGSRKRRSPVADDWQSSTGAGTAPHPQPRAHWDRRTRRGGTLASPRRRHRFSDTPAYGSP